LEQRVDDTDAALSWSPRQVRDNAHRLIPETTLTQEELAELIAVIDDLPTATDLKRLWSAIY
jgi:hypothetical protein